MNISPDTIDQEKQNKPTLIVRDLSPFVAPELVYATLMRRGVFKWLAVRQQLIRLKDEWRREITAAQAEIKAAKQDGCVGELQYARGKLAALIQCREAVRRLCHSPRWQVQTNDSAAAEWMREKENNNWRGEELTMDTEKETT